MRRKVSALLTVVVAMVLSVALATPANAADDFWTQYAAKNNIANGTQYKYSFNYSTQQWYPNQLFNSAAKTTIPVSPTVHPSSSGASWYLNQYRNRAANPANIPIQGKIIVPGQTVVRAPSTYVAAAGRTVGLVAGVARVVGLAGVGIGGTSTPPSNWQQLALGQGVPQTCIDDLKTCGKANMDKVIGITSCGLKGTCNSIGAVQGDSNDFTKWFDNTALPFLDDLWAQITGQKVDMTPSDAHQEVSVRGCKKEVGFEYTGDNKGKIHVRVIEDKGRPPSSQISNRAYYDDGCYGAAASAPYVSPGNFNTTCINKSTGLVESSTYFASGGLQDTWWNNTTGESKTALCGPGSPTTHELLMIRFWNSQTQAQANASPSDWDQITYSEWVNPDPKLNTIEDTKITTTWDCRDAAGTVLTYTKDVSKTAAFVSPDCPVGSELIRHDVKGTTAGGAAQTLDSGAEKPGGLAAYPECQTQGCSLQVFLDGTACTVARAACSTWPAVAAQSPSRIVCKWGSYTMPTSDCNALSNGYKTETGVIFDPKSGTWVAIDTYGNPVAPNPEPWNPTNPNPIAGATPGTPPSTGTTTPGSTFPQTGTNPDTSDNCSAPTWSWNPVEFVKNPVVCALIDAFVPKTDVQARIQGISNAAADTVPIAWISTPIVGPSGGGCPNWNIQVAGLSQNVVCDSSFTAAIVGSRGPMFGIVASAMLWPLIRGIWYALIPIVRVNPGSSK